MNVLRLVIPAMLVLSPALATAATAAEVKSPDGNVVVAFKLTDTGGLSYNVSYRGRPILVESRLGLELKDAPALEKGFRVVRLTPGSHDETWKPVYGEQSEIRDHYNQLDVDLEDDRSPPRRLRLTFRAYDEGAAVCYTLPEQDALKQFVITRENTEFRFTGNHLAWPVYSAQGVYSPLQFLFWYDRPQQYRGEPELEFFKHVPTVWDETRVIHGRIGRYVTIARRSGRAWYVGSLNAVARRELEIPLSFLEPGRKYLAEVYGDASPEGDAPTGVGIGRMPVDSASVIPADMAANGGQAIRIVPQ